MPKATKDFNRKAAKWSRTLAPKGSDGARWAALSAKGEATQADWEAAKAEFRALSTTKSPAKPRRSVALSTNESKAAERSNARSADWDAYFERVAAKLDLTVEETRRVSADKVARTMIAKGDTRSDEVLKAKVIKVRAKARAKMVNA